jgi:molecular chaperone DnaK (HSP70)
MAKFVGIDLGSSKTVIIADDGDIVLTSTGSISRPTLVTFVGRTRLVGEEAAAQASA